MTKPYMEPAKPVREFVRTGASPHDAVIELWPNGPTCILFYPGTMLEPGHYHVLLDALHHAGFTVAGLHLRGHGCNMHRSGFTFRSLLAQGLRAERWLRRRGFHVAVCGHSQGGIFAMAHAASSSAIVGAFAICAIFPQMDEAIQLTRFAPFSRKRRQIMACITILARIAPWFPVPMPAYLSFHRVLAGMAPPVITGTGRGRLCYPLEFIASLFAAQLSPNLKCPFWLISARDDALFTPELILQTFSAINAPRKSLLWLTHGGHLAPLNPGLADFVARHMAASCAGMGQYLRLSGVPG